MPALTRRRAVWVAALIACAVYLPSLRNRWALDDHGLVELNPAAHSIEAALHAAFSPYWPHQGDFSAGLYRPLVTLSYAVDWALSGGRPWWFHLTNLLMHGLATALVVLLALAWLDPPGALVSGLVFATHSVHVEAVADVAGRAEVMAALGLLAAVLAARAYRRACASSSHSDPARAAGGSRRKSRPGPVFWLFAVLAALLLALGSKEHAVVALFLIALDQALGEAQLRKVGWNLYVALAAVTVGWLFLWRAVAGPYFGAGAVVWLSKLPLGQRLAAAIPVQLDVVRLLVWPARLAADYNPQTIPVRDTWTTVATIALVTTTALLVLAWLVRRRAPAVAFGILAAGATYLPTSNLLFTSGVVLAERTLYFAVLAPALAAGWLVMVTLRSTSRAVSDSAERGTGIAGQRLRFHVVALVSVACVALGTRTIARIPFWRDTRAVLFDTFLEHPENFSNQIRLADALVQSGDSGRALAQYLVALELYDGYSFLPVRAGRLALALGRLRLAVMLARQAHAMAPEHPDVAQFLADAFFAVGQPDSALAAVRTAAARNPMNRRMLETLGRTLERVHASAWDVELAHARIEWLAGRFVAASAAIDSAALEHTAQVGRPECPDLQQALPMLRMLEPGDTTAVQRLSSNCRETVAVVSQ
jgi:tetratricopeptide (TPR) repeat protein